MLDCDALDKTLALATRSGPGFCESHRHVFVIILQAGSRCCMEFCCYTLAIPLLKCTSARMRCLVTHDIRALQQYYSLQRDAHSPLSQHLRGKPLHRRMSSYPNILYQRQLTLSKYALFANTQTLEPEECPAYQLPKTSPADPDWSSCLVRRLIAVSVAGVDSYPCSCLQSRS